MKADNASISKVFSGGGDIHYVLPHFQREYTWQKQNWETLLKDALTVYDEAKPDGNGGYTDIEHFMGSIVVVHDGMRAATVTAFKLVDGQQRLTSLSLLLKVVAENVPDQAVAGKIERLLVNPAETGDLYYKILPTTKSGDRTAYMAVLRNEAPPPCASDIPRAYQFFRQEVAARVREGLDPEKLFQVIIHAFQVVFVNLGQGESPYRIFESLNAKGKALTQADLVRNYVAMTLPASRQERLFKDYWMPIEELLQERRKVGKLPEFTAFLRHYLALKTDVLCDEDHVYARFRDRAEREFNTADKFEQELKTIVEFARCYDKLLRPEKIQHQGISNAIRRLNTLEASSAYPLLMQMIAAVDRGVLAVERVVELLDCIENYMVRRFLAGEASSYLNRAFTGLWNELDQADILRSIRKVLSSKRYPGDGRVARAVKDRALYEKGTQTRRRLVLILETINRRLSQGSGGFTVLDGAATIEHVMPQTLSGEWKEHLGLMWEQIHKDNLHALGNLTIVTGGWNAELSNAVFSVKRAKLAENALRLNSTYFSVDMPRWGRDEIRERAETLSDQILAIWPTFDPNVPDEPEHAAGVSEFHFEVVERVSARTGVGFLKLSQSRFESSDGKHRLVGMCSKPYPRKERGPRYWYGLRTYHREFLAWSGTSWIALEFAPSGRALLIPFDRFEPWLRSLRQTEGQHWHIDILENNGRIELPLPAAGTAVDVTEFAV